MRQSQELWSVLRKLTRRTDQTLGDFFLFLLILSGAISGLPAALLPLRVRILHVILQFAIGVERLMANLAGTLLLPDILLLIVRILRHKKLPLL
jgi:hypothetical protein